MNIEISQAAECVTVVFHITEQKVFTYSTRDEINITTFVNSLSESPSKVIVTPPNFQTYQESARGTDIILLKTCEYIYLIIEEFNKCYDSIYPSSECPVSVDK